jgi:2-phospho-L-lactate guanylyltransferase
MIFALLPVKSPQNAKQRLSGLLSASQRERLARLMYEDTLATLCRAGGIDRVVVVTNDSEAAEHARRSGVLVFEERDQQSHSISADGACRRAMEMGAATALLVPIDVPLATRVDFERLAAAAGRGLAIVPSTDGTGTNALVRTPPDIIQSRFGPGSFRKHVEQAEAKGVPVEVLRLRGLMFDIDTPEDVTELLECAPHSRAASFLQSACASK